jgi:Ca2+-binding RTX toxin-like protein
VAGPGNDRFGQVRGRDNEIRGGPGRDQLRLETASSARLSDQSIRYRYGRADLSSIDRAELWLGPESTGTVNAAGFSGTTLIRGSIGDDVLIGGSGKDKINGSWGADTLMGGAGRDRLDGDRGIDTCDGGSGVDRLIDCEQT